MKSLIKLQLCQMKGIMISQHFSDYFSGHAQEFKDRTLKIDSSVVSSSLVWVHASSFSDLTDRGIVITLPNSHLVIEETSFTSCSSLNKDGGAIYFNCIQGGSVMKRICASTCTATNAYGQFCAIITDTFQYNSFLDSTIYLCSNVIGNNAASVIQINGNHTFKNFNSSHIYLYVDSGLFTQSCDEGLILYSTFAHQYSLGIEAFMLDLGYTGDMVFSLSNFVNLTVINEDFGVIYSWNGDFTLENCTFLDCSVHLLAFDSPGSFILTGCTIHNPYTSWGDIQILNPGISVGTQAHSFLAMGACKAVIPLGSPTTYNPTSNQEAQTPIGSAVYIILGIIGVIVLGSISIFLYFQFNNNPEAEDTFV